MTLRKLVFVYNADSTLFAAATDFVKKIITPNKNECNLCSVTHGVIGMKTPWQEYLESLPYEIVFLHRDEFHKKYPSHKEMKLPTIMLMDDGGALQTMLSAQEIESAHSIVKLKEILNKALCL